ncbi:carboxymuconolactone decarboxylase family protein [Limimaricola soesokkakensis]|uniref:carboxymuconolactone decarboxylase family protein n=1 Tax=Limimaricola soesokkakensis TaxID=1343159 RepID=UPI0035121A41
MIAPTRDLIAFAAAVYLPDKDCSYAHRGNARETGVSKGEIHEALAVAGNVRMWRTM